MSESHTKESGRIARRVHLEVMEISLHKTWVTSAQNKAVKFRLESESKMVTAKKMINNIIMRTGPQ